MEDSRWRKAEQREQRSISRAEREAVETMKKERAMLLWRRWKEKEKRKREEQDEEVGGMKKRVNQRCSFDQPNVDPSLRFLTRMKKPRKVEELVLRERAMMKKTDKSIRRKQKKTDMQKNIFTSSYIENPSLNIYDHKSLRYTDASDSIMYTSSSLKIRQFKKCIRVNDVVDTRITRKGQCGFVIVCVYVCFVSFFFQERERDAHHSSVSWSTCTRPDESCLKKAQLPAASICNRINKNMCRKLVQSQGYH